MKTFMEMNWSEIEDSGLELYELSDKELVHLIDEMPDYSYVGNYDYECMGEIENELFNELENRTDISIEDFTDRDYILYGVRDDDGYHCQMCVSKEEFEENLEQEYPYESHIDEERDIDRFITTCVNKLGGYDIK